MATIDAPRPDARHRGAAELIADHPVEAEGRRRDDVRMLVAERVHRPAHPRPGRRPRPLPRRGRRARGEHLADAAGRGARLRRLGRRAPLDRTSAAAAGSSRSASRAASAAGPTPSTTARSSRWPAAALVRLRRPYSPPVAGGRRLWQADVLTPGAAAGVPRRARADPIRYGCTDTAWPIADYQTVFARRPPATSGLGSAEMPSAGRPFTPELVRRLVDRGVVFAPITLHTGVSSLEAHEPPVRRALPGARVDRPARQRGPRRGPPGHRGRHHRRPGPSRPTPSTAAPTPATAGPSSSSRPSAASRSSTASSAAGTSPRPATSSSWKPSPAARSSRPATTPRSPSATTGTSSATSTSSCRRCDSGWRHDRAVRGGHRLTTRAGSVAVHGVSGHAVRDSPTHRAGRCRACRRLRSDYENRRLDDAAMAAPSRRCAVGHRGRPPPRSTSSHRRCPSRWTRSRSAPGRWTSQDLAVQRRPPYEARSTPIMHRQRARRGRRAAGLGGPPLRREAVLAPGSAHARGPRRRRPPGSPGEARAAVDLRTVGSRSPAAIAAG